MRLIHGAQKEKNIPLEHNEKGEYQRIEPPLLSSKQSASEEVQSNKNRLLRGAANTNHIPVQAATDSKRQKTAYIRDKPYSRRKPTNWDRYTFIPTNENGELAVKTEIC